MKTVARILKWFHDAIVGIDHAAFGRRNLGLLISNSDGTRSGRKCEDRKRNAMTS